MSKALGINYPMFPYNPSKFGRNLHYVAGKKSGKAFIRRYLAEKGLKATQSQIEEILIRVKKRGIVLKDFLSNDELDGIIQAVLQ